MEEVVYPAVWGPGQLVAFSGLDGETDWFHPFVATTLADDVGLLFPLRVPRRLWCEPARMVVRDLRPRIVLGDCIEFLVTSTRGLSFALRYLFLDRFTVIGETIREMPVEVRSDAAAAVSRGPDVVTHSSREEYTALVTKEFGDKLIFAFAFSPESEQDAVRRARAALGTNLAGLLQRKLLFYSTLHELPRADARRRQTLAKACSILRANVESPQGLIPCRWSTPDRWPHRDLWLWDSCFHALGARTFHPDLAAELLSAVLAGQREDGFIAHRTSPTGMSDVTGPPLLAWTFFELFRSAGALSPVQKAYPQLVRFIEWILANRRVEKSGLLAWKMTPDEFCRSLESGMDNSPRFDSGEPVEAVDFNSYVIREMKCLAEMALLLKRFGDAAAWKERVEELTAAVNGLLWDESDGFYYDRTLEGERVRIKASSGFLPLFAGVVGQARAERLVEHLTSPDEFWTAFPVPSVARSESAFELDMWRGPTWLNIDLLIVDGLKSSGFPEQARELTEKALGAVERWYARLGSIFEFYDPDGRVPPPELDRKQRLKRGEGIAPVSDHGGAAACFLALAAGLSDAS
jgi:glycogen debranching enzyme